MDRVDIGIGNSMGIGVVVVNEDGVGADVKIGTGMVIGTAVGKQSGADT